jgi:hypothetical protein
VLLSETCNDEGSKATNRNISIRRHMTILSAQTLSKETVGAAAETETKVVAKAAELGGQGNEV